jgi:succinoglycan biosynthesis protein ExoM
MRNALLKPTPSIDIGICTFRRAQVADTIRSIARLTRPEHCLLRVLVADNDVTPSSQALVEATRRDTGLDVLYIHAPAQNISLARNACLDAATAPLLAFIDDDEEVAIGWLPAMLATLATTQADVVFGPVHARYSDTCPAWLRRGDYLTTTPVQTPQGITTGYAGNVVLRRAAPAIQGQRFRPELGLSGGEDTLFFAAIAARGGHLAYAPEAIVTETVAPERQNLGWLIKRRFRFGQTHGQLLLESGAQSWPQRLRAIAIATTKAMFCWCASVCTLYQKDRAIGWSLRAALHAGVVARLLGKPVLELYGRG